MRDYREDIKAELRDLGTEIESVGPLLDKVKVEAPDAIEIRAIATTLHAFYSGIERVCVMIAKAIDNKTPTTAQWHRDLLDQMNLPTKTRGAVISAELHHRLSDYLGFRHFFRHSYPMQLNWALLEPLTRELRETFDEFVSQIRKHIGD